MGLPERPKKSKKPNFQKLILGMPGTGKSYRLWKEVHLHLKSLGARISTDWKGARWYDGPFVGLYDPSIELPEIWGMPVVFAEDAESAPHYPFVSFPSALEATEWTARQRGNNLLVIEEALTIPTTERQPIREIIVLRRHKGMYVYVTSQRPKDIPTIFFAFATHRDIGRIEQPQDLKMLEKYVTPEQAARIPELGVEENSEFLEVRGV